VKLDPAIRDQVLASVPNLRAFAVSLCHNIDSADDLVQDTLLRALTHIDSFEPGTNMRAWLFTILRNVFRSERRKWCRMVEDPDGQYAETLKSYPEQIGRIEFGELRAALAKLPADQRDALILVAAAGFSYDEAATVCGCRQGTIKSRVNRARARLADLLSVDSIEDFGPDGATRAILAESAFGLN
jgi:RNA polymerase sigma-70 factor, ECF subfamily